MAPSRPQTYETMCGLIYVLDLNGTNCESFTPVCKVPIYYDSPPDFCRHIEREVFRGRRTVTKQEPLKACKSDFLKARWLPISTPKPMLTPQLTAWPSFLRSAARG